MSTTDAPSASTPLVGHEPAGLTQSRCWRLYHGINYMIGGITFLVGSLMYFPEVNGLETGGWLFTVGSAAFLLADLHEWWFNRVGCCGDRGNCVDGPDLRAAAVGQGQSPGACNGINFFWSVIGSALYLAGSIAFIPELDSLLAGQWLFIVGSAFIFTSQYAKIHRGGGALAVWREDAAAFVVDAMAGVGGVFYFVGTILSLPAYDPDDAATTRYADLFTLGGLAFSLSGLALNYRYFCGATHPMPSTNAQTSFGPLWPCMA